MESESAKRAAGAYHEAGHAVVGRCNGGELSGMWLSPEGAGRTFFRKRTGLEPRATARLGMGGPAAEYIFMNPTATEFSLADCNASEQDLDDIYKPYSAFPQEQQDQLLREDWIAACQTLRTKWDSVRRVAEKLLQYDNSIVNADDLHPLIN